MQKKIWDTIVRIKWLLPIISGILFVLAIPPISVWQFSLFGFVPLFFFMVLAAGDVTDLKKGRRDAIVGTLIFALIYAGYVSYSTLSGFQWLQNAEFFVTFVHMGGVAAVLGVAIVYTIYVWLAVTLLSRFAYLRSMHPGIFAVLITLGTIIPEYFFFYAYAGFNFGALFFAGQEIALIRGLIDTGSPMVISFVVMIINMAIAYTALILLGKAPVRFFWYIVGALLALLLVLALIADEPAPIERELRVAIIQEASRDSTESFGAIIDGAFVFPKLEAHIAEATKSNPEMMIYPFAPWSGVISENLDNSRFDRDVIGMSDEIFSEWLRKHVPEDVIFVAWYTAYRSGDYYNQIGYFKNGELVGVYKKEKLFPFFDYVPEWALRTGVVSLPFDATPGINNETYVFEDIPIGTLVCSEVGSMSATYNSAQESRIIFSLGSETMFDHEIPSEYNALRASLSAELHDIPVVRGNKFGPSVVYDANGEEIGRIEFEETGVLVVDIPIPATK